MDDHTVLAVLYVLLMLFTFVYWLSDPAEGGQAGCPGEGAGGEEEAGI